MKEQTVKSVLGSWKIKLSEDGLEQINLPPTPPSAPPKGKYAVAFPPLKSYFSRRATRPQKLAAWKRATPFQRKVWSELLKIPFGSTRTYAEIAKRIGSPAASRAVGNACGANPIPVLVPCHRVVASSGKLGGFSAGLGWKKWLLKFEADTGKQSVSHVRQGRQD